LVATQLQKDREPAEIKGYARMGDGTRQNILLFSLSFGMHVLKLCCLMPLNGGLILEYIAVK